MKLDKKLRREKNRKIKKKEKLLKKLVFEKKKRDISYNETKKVFDELMKSPVWQNKENS